MAQNISNRDLSMSKLEKGGSVFPKKWAGSDSIKQGGLSQTKISAVE